jgi:hypothetical protein
MRSGELSVIVEEVEDVDEEVDEENIKSANGSWDVDD